MRASSGSKASHRSALARPTVAGALTVASGGWLVGILLGYFEWQGLNQVLSLLVLFGIGVASLFVEIWLLVKREAEEDWHR